MPHDTSRPPQDRPWEGGWAADTSRIPGTRRLWLAGALALATVATCVTAIVVTRRPADDPAGSSSASATAAPPGLISYASDSPSPSVPASESAERTASPSPTEKEPKHHEKTSAAAEPSVTASPSSPAPVPTATERSVRSVNFPDRGWQVSGGLVRLTGSPDTYTLRKGLAKPSCYSFATADGRYLRHRDFVLRAERDDGSGLFAQDATFCARDAAHAGAVMLESVNYPGRFLRHKNFQLRLDPYQSSGLYLADSAFRLH
ncbi:AbfB domain-containing protein [Streptomyces sp. G1]|uniref:AbfB domain-containing protein n=1 Tax=Streptomyces sp. G1 TaxID=361572 RepID=UPI00202DB676|nr:AbfB domain-containing protein [Streptomyces sp. G1]MCM1972745.1 AbfB domain-containing protein [Streptomyces sp. G1]